MPFKQWKIGDLSLVPRIAHRIQFGRVTESRDDETIPEAFALLARRVDIALSQLGARVLTIALVAWLSP